MADWTFSDYQNAAKAAFAALDKTWGNAAWFSYDKNGANPKFKQFKDSAEASAAYDAVTAAPGQAWFVALYDTAKSATADGGVDETYFGGVAATPIVSKRPIAAIVATTLAAGIAVFAGRRKRRR